MKKICMMLVGGALLLATPATASTPVSQGFRNYGACNSVIHWFINATKWGIEDTWGGWAPLAGTPLRCERMGEYWFVVID